MIKEYFDVEFFLINILGLVIGVYVGYGIFVLFFIG